MGEHIPNDVYEDSSDKWLSMTNTGLGDVGGIFHLDHRSALPCQPLPQITPRNLLLIINA